MLLTYNLYSIAGTKLDSYLRGWPVTSNAKLLVTKRSKPSRRSLL